MKKPTSRDFLCLSCPANKRGIDEADTELMPCDFSVEINDPSSFSSYLLTSRNNKHLKKIDYIGYRLLLVWLRATSRRGIGYFLYG